MLFYSVEFLVCFAALLIVYWATPWRRARVWMLLVASFCFYASWSKWLALIVCASTLLDYLLALGMEYSTVSWRRKLLLCLSLVANLGLLCFFKYVNFFLGTLTEGLHALGSPSGFRTLELIVPLGISFYTFEAINYTVDVYRRRIPAERNLADFMLFILFFPHLAAGPIVRAKDFLPQIKRPKRCDWVRIHLGVQYFLMGLFKKLAIADRMALLVVPVYDRPLSYDSSTAWMAIFAYALQVYCDFSGYSDMALGTAHMLGYKLTKNFDMPYLSANIAEFWNRWHISLSTWLRDYLFIPLGGSRGGNWKTNRNLLITMTLCGLWHGAKWTLVGFGALQGVMLIAHRGFARRCRQWPRLQGLLLSPGGTLGRIAFTFVAFCTSLVVFRADNFTKAFEMYVRLLSPAPWSLSSPIPEFGFWLTVGVIVICHILGKTGVWIRPGLRLSAPVLGFGYATLLALALLLSPQGVKEFIYFNF
jgi:alginate O-acetyltransferase complex protein AlgI